MNAFFSFDLFMVYIPECNQHVRLWNNTCRYWEILHNLNLGCSFIILRELCNNQWPRCDIAWLHVANLYTTVFWVKCLNNLTLCVRLFNRLIGKPWYKSYGTYEMSSNYWELEKVGLHNKIHSYRSKMKLWDARGTCSKIRVSLHVILHFWQVEFELTCPHQYDLLPQLSFILYPSYFGFTIQCYPQNYCSHELSVVDPYCWVVLHIMTYWVSEWLLFNTNSEIFQLYHDKNKLVVNEMMMRFTLY
jgi:hypothetical protein